MDAGVFQVSEKLTGARRRKVIHLRQYPPTSLFGWRADVKTVGKPTAFPRGCRVFPSVFTTGHRGAGLGQVVAQEEWARPGRAHRG